MNQINIRKATLEDLPYLLAFEQGIIQAERPFDPTLKEGKISYYDIEKMLNIPSILVVVATIDCEIVGSGYARIDEAKAYLKHANYAYLGFMFTAKPHRGKGVNAKILDALKTWCQSQNIIEMRLDVYHENTIATKAYEKAGFAKHLLNMRLGLE